MASTIAGFGNPLLDISATVEQAVLDEWGAELNNAILAEDKHKPLYKKLVDTHAVEYIAGGATLNSIRVAQWMLSSAEKTKVSSFIGCIGADAFGATLKAQLARDGVRGCFLETADTPTGTCAVLVKDSERSLIANLAAAEKYDIAHYKGTEAQGIVATAEIFYMAGFPLTHEGGKATVMAICEHAAAAGKVVCMNVSAPFIAQFFKDPLLAAFEYCDVIFCNESEAAALAEACGWNLGDDSVAIAEKIAALPSKRSARRKAIVTQGADATVVATAGAGVRSYPVHGNPWTLSKSDLVDTNGAAAGARPALAACRAHPARGCVRPTRRRRRFRGGLPVPARPGPERR